MFRWGDAKKIIEQKLTDTMIPAIKTYDFSKYVQQLDIIMNELLHSLSVICNNKILRNFKTIVTPPDTKSVTLEQLFIEYCNFVAENIDTADRNVEYEDGVYYEPIECMLESENIASEYTHDKEYERYTLSFHTDEYDAKTEYNEPLNFDITLYRWRWMNPGEYNMHILIDPCSVKRMTDFEAFIYSLPSI